MLENAAIFTTPDVPLATLLTVSNNLTTAAQEAESGDHAKVVAMHAADKYGTRRSGLRQTMSIELQTAM